MGSVTGNRKRRKGDQPKRIRYNVSKRYETNRIKDLRRHLKHYPNDAVAESYLNKLTGESISKKDLTKPPESAIIIEDKKDASK